MRNLTILSLLVLLLAACNAPTAPTTSAEMAITQAAETVAAQFTQQATIRGTATPRPTETLPPPPTATMPAEQPTAAQPAVTQPPAATATTAPTAASNTADAGSFVDDITVPDGTAAQPGAIFDKTWRIKNTGTTTWSPSYGLVVVDGDRMGAPDVIPMPKEVRPGETVDITVKLTAPSAPGTYQTYFRLRNAGGQFFRLDGSGDLWLKIIVGNQSTATIQPTNTPDPNATATTQP